MRRFLCKGGGCMYVWMDGWMDRWDGMDILVHVPMPTPENAILEKQTDKQTNGGI